MLPYLLDCRRCSDKMSLIIVSLTIITTDEKNLIWHRDLRVITIPHPVVRITRYSFEM